MTQQSVNWFVCVGYKTLRKILCFGVKCVLIMILTLFHFIKKKFTVIDYPLNISMCVCVCVNLSHSKEHPPTQLLSFSCRLYNGGE